MKLEVLLPKQEKLIPKPENKILAALNDRGLRLALIPLFAIAVPNLTGLAHYHYPVITIIFHYLYFLLISVSVYYGNRYLLFQLSDRFNWFYSPFRKVLTLLAGVILYTLPVTVFFIGLFYVCILNEPLDETVLRNVCLMNVICVIFVAHIYETVFLIKHTENEMVRTAKIEQAKAEAELEALKSQIDPHFIFNSLNTLSHLITQDQQKAKLFNDNLADVYRYILQNKSRSLVFLKDEILFLENYFSLLHIRFGDSIQLALSISGDDAANFLLPPISLQFLLENCVKHNEFNHQHPMVVEVFIDGKMVVCRNRKRSKQYQQKGTETGLINLSGRFKMLTGEAIVIDDAAEYFIVKLPLLSSGI